MSAAKRSVGAHPAAAIRATLSSARCRELSAISGRKGESALALAPLRRKARARRCGFDSVRIRANCVGGFVAAVSLLAVNCSKCKISQLCGFVWIENYVFDCICTNRKVLCLKIY